MRRIAQFGAAVLLIVNSNALAQQELPALLLFGGANHKVFLGCLNCGRFDAGSVCNRFGDYGNRFNSDSIWNRFGDYGSRFSMFSPWNKYASDPPIVVDGDGNSYGYFTSNRYHANRTQIRGLLAFVDNPDEVNEDLNRARDVFCE